MSDEIVEKTGGAGTENKPQGGTPESTQSQVEAEEDWYAGQSQEIIELINENLRGMRNTISERTRERQELREQLKAIRKTRDLDAEAKLDKIGAQLDAAEKRAVILESLPFDVGDRKLAYLAVLDGDYVRRDGTVDEEKLRAEHPDLFHATSFPPGHAGAGAGDSSIR